MIEPEVSFAWWWMVCDERVDRLLDKIVNYSMVEMGRLFGVKPLHMASKGWHGYIFSFMRCWWVVYDERVVWLLDEGIDYAMAKMDKEAIQSI